MLKEKSVFLRPGAIRFGWADRAVLVIRLYSNDEIAWPRSIGRAKDVRSVSVGKLYLGGRIRKKNY